MELLPNEIIDEIASFLSFKELKTFTLCSHKIHNLLAYRIWNRPRFIDRYANNILQLKHLPIKELYYHDFCTHLSSSILEEGATSLETLIIQYPFDWGLNQLTEYENCPFTIRLYTCCMEIDDDDEFNDFISLCKRMDIELEIIQYIKAQWSMAQLEKCEGIRIRNLEKSSIRDSEKNPEVFNEIVKKLNVKHILT